MKCGTERAIGIVPNDQGNEAGAWACCSVDPDCRWMRLELQYCIELKRDRPGAHPEPPYKTSVDAKKMFTSSSQNGTGGHRREAKQSSEGFSFSSAVKRSNVAVDKEGTKWFLGGTKGANEENTR